jgi:hypothetical protein
VGELLSPVDFRKEASGLLLGIARSRTADHRPFDCAACSQFGSASEEDEGTRRPSDVFGAVEFGDAVDAAMGGIGGPAGPNRAARW